MKNYYIEKGYVFTKVGDLFEVKVEDLPYASNVYVNVQCDYCGEKYSTQYGAYNKTVRDGKNACKKCSSKRTEETNLKKYGVKNVFELDEIKTKSKDTLINKYGVENISQLPENQEKIKKNNLEKYGVTNTSKLDSTKQKVVETNRQKFGVDYPMQTEEFQNRIKETSMKLYGVNHFTQNKDVIQKRKSTVKERYGVEYAIQNKNILHKSIKSRYLHGNFTCSKQQYQLYECIGGELNYPFKNFVIDVAFVEDKIAIEWDGSGHDLSVRMGKISQSEFDRNENFRNKILFENDWRTIKFITKKDIFPNNILDIFNYCMTYLDNGGHYIRVFLDENVIKYKDEIIDINDILNISNVC